MRLDVNSKVAVVGAGVMGSGIAQVAAAHGHNVVVYDRSAEALERGRSGISRGLTRQVEKGKIADAERIAVESGIVWTNDPGLIAEANLVVEAIIETFEAKAAAFDEVSRIVSEDCIISSNTSSLSIASLAKTVSHPERFVGLHFFNPVPVMKLVEIVPAPATSPTTIAEVTGLMLRWDKKAARVRDVPGFIVNRVARPYYSEAFIALAEGVVPETIDRLLEDAGGFRMGPLTLTDMIGQDINFSVASEVFEGYAGKTRFRPQDVQRALVERGDLGRKSGKGVYSYPEGRGEPKFVRVDGEADDIAVAELKGDIVLLADLLRSSGQVLKTDASLAPGTMRVDNIVIAMGDGRPMSVRDGIDVLVDHARDFGAAATLGVTARNDAAAQSVARLFALIEKRIVILPDRPGQLVLRTLAQLANAAADAVADGVASEADIDLAMQYGANHPEGPLAWSRGFGLQRLANVLANIADATNDAIYRLQAHWR